MGSTLFNCNILTNESWITSEFTLRPILLFVPDVQENDKVQIWEGTIQNITMETEHIEMWFFSFVTLIGYDEIFYSLYMVFRLTFNFLISNPILCDILNQFNEPDKKTMMYKMMLESLKCLYHFNHNPYFFLNTTKC